MAQQDGQVHKVLGSEALGILLGRWRDGTFSGIADALGQNLLYIHMNILIIL